MIDSDDTGTIQQSSRSVGAFGSPTDALAATKPLWLWDVGPLQYQQQQQQAAAQASAGMFEAEGSGMQHGMAEDSTAHLNEEGGDGSNHGGLGLLAFPTCGRLSVSFGFDRDADVSHNGGVDTSRGVREGAEQSMLSATGDNDDVCSVSSNSLHGDETPGDEAEGKFFGSFDDSTGGPHQPLANKMSSFYGRVLGTYREAVQDGGVVLQHTGFDIHNIPVHQQGDSSMYDEENLMKRAALQTDPVTNQLLQAVWDAMPKVANRSPNATRLIPPPPGTPSARSRSMSLSLSAPPSPAAAPPLTPRGGESHLATSSRLAGVATEVPLADGGGFVTFNVYRAMSAYVFRRLVPMGSVDDFLRHCEADWKQFSAPPSPSMHGGTKPSSSKPVMNKQQFFKAMFAVADVWTTTAEADEYHHFMERVLLKQAKKISLIDPSLHFNVERNVFAKGAFHKRRGKKPARLRTGSQTPSRRSPAAQGLGKTPPAVPLMLDDAMAASSSQRDRHYGKIALEETSQSKRSRMPALALDVVSVEPNKEDGHQGVSGTVLNAEQRLKKLFSALMKPREAIVGAAPRRRMSRQAVAISLATFDTDGHYTAVDDAVAVGGRGTSPAAVDARIATMPVSQCGATLYANPSFGNNGEPAKVLNPAEIAVAMPTLPTRRSDGAVGRQLTSIVLVDDTLMSATDRGEPSLPVFTRRDGSHILVAASSRAEEAFQCVVQECTSVFSWCDADPFPAAAEHSSAAGGAMMASTPLPVAADVIEIPSPRGHAYDASSPPPPAIAVGAGAGKRKVSRQGAVQPVVVPRLAALPDDMPPLPLLPTPPPQAQLASSAKPMGEGGCPIARKGSTSVTPQGVFALPFELKPSPSSMKGRKFARHRIDPTPTQSPTPTTTAAASAPAGIAYKPNGAVATPVQSSKRPHPPTHHSTRGPLAPKFPFEIAPSTVVARRKNFRQECGEVISDEILQHALERRREDERFQFAAAVALAEAEDAARSRHTTPVPQQPMVPSASMLTSARHNFTPDIGITSHQVVPGAARSGATASMQAIRTPRLGAPDGVRGALPPGALRQVLGIVPRIVPNTKSGKIVVVAPDANPLHPAQRHQVRGTIPSAPRGAPRHPIQMKVYESYDRAHVDHLLSGPLLGGQVASQPSVLRQQRRVQPECAGETLEAIVCSEPQRYPKSLSALAAAAWSQLEADGLLQDDRTANSTRCLLSKALPGRFQKVLKQIKALEHSNEDAVKQEVDAQIAELLSADAPDVLLLALTLAKQASLEATKRRLGRGTHQTSMEPTERLALPAIPGALKIGAPSCETSVAPSISVQQSEVRAVSPQRLHQSGRVVKTGFDETFAEISRSKGAGDIKPHVSSSPSRHLVVVHPQLSHLAWSSLVQGVSNHATPAAPSLHGLHPLPLPTPHHAPVGHNRDAPDPQPLHLQLDEAEGHNEEPSMLDRPALFSARLMSHAPERDVPPSALFRRVQCNDPGLNPALQASAYRNEQRQLLEQLIAAEHEQRQEARNALVKAAASRNQVPSRLRQHAAQAGHDV